MLLKRWEELPDSIRLQEVRPYYDALSHKKLELALKRFFDFLFSAGLLLLLAVPMSVIAILIRMDSRGPVFFTQDRATAYGKHFKIYKFRTMVSDAETLGTCITLCADERVTRLGKVLRKSRLDELPQLFNVLTGDMSFVGTRPEVFRYVEKYRPVFMATLLLPAGITSEASIKFKNESELLVNADDADRFYIEEILPQKMLLNLKSIRHYSLIYDFITLFHTVCSMFE